MTLWTGPLFPFLVLVWPLLLAAIAVLPAARAATLRVLPLAPLPALWLALAPLTGQTTEVPGLFLGVSLGLDAGRALLLAMTAAVWVLGGLAAQRMAGDRRIGVFAGMWGLTLTGNLGVLLAQDITTFYISFAAVSLAGWALVVHDRDAGALRAGRVYLVMAVLGEVALMVGLLLGAGAAQSLLVADVRAALATAPHAPLAIALLLAGFGIKAGMVPLHLWLPLAHPAAPVAASAVLSGAIVKAGLVGMMVFVPDGAAGPVLVALGLAGAFGAALWALTQANPKAVLAYSTVSQMGVLILLVGAGGAAREVAPYYALHHGLAKAALFLLVGGVYLARTPGQRWLTIGLAALVAASVAGMPLTGGALTKTAAKAALSPGLAWALTLTSATTTLALGWFLWRLAQVARPQGSAPGLARGLAPGLAGGWAAFWAVPAVAAVAALVAPWVLWADWTALAPGYPLTPSVMVDGLWPIALALPVVALLCLRPVPEQPPGDLLTLARRAPALPDWRADWRADWPDLPRLDTLRVRMRKGLATRLSGLERRLTRWEVGGPVLLVAVLALTAMLG